MGLLERGEVSARELCDAYRAAIDARDDELHCFLTLVDEPDGDGVPIALKDVIGTKGIETTAGSKILEGLRAGLRLDRRARAARTRASSLLGKTNTDEFAMGSSTENSAFGPSRNPWDPTRVPGGSGGGSAAAVAAGSRRGRSARTPAARSSSRRRSAGSSGCGRRTGPSRATGSSRSRRRSTRSGRRRRRCATARSSTGSSRAATRATRRPSTFPPVELPEREDLKGVRVGVPKRAERGGGDRAGRARRRSSARSSSRASSAPRSGSASCRARSSTASPCYYLVAPAEASSNLARYDGVRYGLRVGDDDYHEMVMRTRDEGFGDEPKRRIMLGTYALSAGYYDAYYGQAQKVRTVIRREHADAFERFDVLVSPTSPTVAFELGAKTQDPLAMYAERPADDPVVHGGPARAERAVRAVARGCPSGCSYRPAVRREHALPRARPHRRFDEGARADSCSRASCARARAAWLRSEPREHRGGDRHRAALPAQGAG